MRSRLRGAYGQRPTCRIQRRWADASFRILGQHGLVSGDFSDKCNPEGFKSAKAFLRHLLDQHLIESPERLILVPGNHDQLRDRGGFVESPTEDPAFSRKNDFGTYYVRGPNYQARFRHWLDLYKDLTKGDYPITERDQAVSHTFPDQKIQFLALNSAWETDILQPRIGSLNADAVARAIGKMDRKCLTIAVWHHAPAEWEDETKTKLAYRLQEASIAIWRMRVFAWFCTATCMSDGLTLWIRITA